MGWGVADFASMPAPPDVCPLFLCGWGEWLYVCLCERTGTLAHAISSLPLGLDWVPFFSLLPL